MILYILTNLEELSNGVIVQDGYNSLTVPIPCFESKQLVNYKHSCKNPHWIRQVTNVNFDSANADCSKITAFTCSVRQEFVKVNLFKYLEFKSLDELRECISAYPEWIEFLPLSYFSSLDDALLMKCIKIVPKLILNVPLERQTRELWEAAVGVNKFYFTVMPRKFQTLEFCTALVDAFASYLPYVAPQLMTYELCLKAYNCSPDVDKYIPNTYKENPNWKSDLKKIIFGTASSG